MDFFLHLNHGAEHAMYFPAMYFLARRKQQSLRAIRYLGLSSACPQLKLATCAFVHQRVIDSCIRFTALQGDKV